MAYSLPVGDTGARLDMFYPFFLTIQFAFFCERGKSGFA